MIPARFIIYDECTGMVTNVVTVEDGDNYPPTFHHRMIANRYLNIGDMVPFDPRERQIRVEYQQPGQDYEGASHADTTPLLRRA